MKNQISIIELVERWAKNNNLEFFFVDNAMKLLTDTTYGRGWRLLPIRLPADILWPQLSQSIVESFIRDEIVKFCRKEQLVNGIALSIREPGVIRYETEKPLYGICVRITHSCDSL